MNIGELKQEELKKLIAFFDSYLTSKGINSTVEVWVSGKRAQEILGVKTTQLYLLRNDPSNGIIFSQPSRKVIMYKVESLYSYLEANVV